MVKVGILCAIVIAVISLGLTVSPVLNGHDRDPVPPTQKVAHSIHCSGCHGYDESGQALVDSKGHDVNIYDDWRISMMGLSAHDPFWRATLEHETALYPAAKDEIESSCLRCHAPLGSIQHQFDGLRYSYEKMLADSLGLDGVSCSACHQQPSQGLGSGHSGHFSIDTNRQMFGPFPNPFKGPMQLYVGFEPVFADHILTSGVCAGCHTLITETLSPEGVPTGNSFIEQATYHEWLNSTYALQGRECQSCHVPFITDSIVIATDFQVLNKRHPFGLHQFYGANTAMLELMREHQKDLSLPEASSPSAWDESIANNRASLQAAAQVTILDWHSLQDTLYVTIEVKNKAGHKLPSGYPSRVAWMRMILTDDMTGDTIYANGLLDEDGMIVGRDATFEPHHQISFDEHDVQIYEMVMADFQGQITTRLSAAYSTVKDNRLLPTGFRLNHAVYDTVAIKGDALLDPDFTSGSEAGTDVMEYRIPLNGRKGFGNLRAGIYYQSIPSRWMHDLFTADTIARVAQFKNMYSGYTLFEELMAEDHELQIELNTTSAHAPAFLESITVSPNPVSGQVIQLLHWPKESDPSLWQFEIIDINGIVKSSGKLSTTIEATSLPGGLYYLVLRHSKKTYRAIPFMRL